MKRSSSGVKSPSGPHHQPHSWLGAEASRVSRTGKRGLAWGVRAATMRVEQARMRGAVSAMGVGGRSSGRRAAPHWRAAAWTMRSQRSCLARAWRASNRTTVRALRTGTMRSTPSSVAFSRSHSMRSPFGTQTKRVRRMGRTSWWKRGCLATRVRASGARSATW